MRLELRTGLKRNFGTDIHAYSEAEELKNEHLILQPSRLMLNKKGSLSLYEIVRR